MPPGEYNVLYNQLSQCVSHEMPPEWRDHGGGGACKSFVSDNLRKLRVKKSHARLLSTPGGAAGTARDTDYQTNYQKRYYEDPEKRAARANYQKVYFEDPARADYHRAYQAEYRARIRAEHHENNLVSRKTHTPSLCSCYCPDA